MYCICLLPLKLDPKIPSAILCGFRSTTLTFSKFLVLDQQTPVQTIDYRQFQKWSLYKMRGGSLCKKRREMAHPVPTKACL